MKPCVSFIALALAAGCASRVAARAPTSTTTMMAREDTPADATEATPERTTDEAVSATASAPVRVPGQCVAPTAASVTATVTGCPSVSGVRVVHRWGTDAPSDACAPPDWVMFSTLLRDDGAEARYFPAGEGAADAQHPRFRRLSEREVRAEGIVPTQEPLWVFPSDDTPPCQATPGAWWIAKTSAGGGEYLEIGRAIHGCQFSVGSDSHYALSSPQRPSDCRYRAMPEVRRTRVFPPPLVRARITLRTCAPPGCTFVSRRAAITLQGGTVDDTQGAYIFHRADRPECSSPFDWYHVVAWTPYLGAPWVRLLGAGPVSGVFYDARGVRGVITDEIGTLRAYATERDDVGSLYVAQQFNWYVPNDEDNAAWRISPSCL